jgi:hypothetical protein
MPCVVAQRRGRVNGDNGDTLVYAARPTTSVSGSDIELTALQRRASLICNIDSSNVQCLGSTMCSLRPSIQDEIDGKSYLLL